MWIRTYNKSGELIQSVELDDLGKTKSYYSISSHEYVKYNDWGKNEKVLEYQLAEEELELQENMIGAKFFRCVSKNNKKGGINYPKYKKTFSVENGGVINFNIDKNKLKQWKTKAQKTSKRRKAKSI